MLEHIAELVVKEVHGSGGYGMLVGPTSTKAHARRVPQEDRGAAGQLHRAADAGALDLPDLSSTRGIAPRHVDLRPYVLVGDQIRITPGGLTRVALKKGSLVVNSSQGGGTKDTWVLED